jgi:sec-independent protein translocase protein TatC
MFLKPALTIRERGLFFSLIPLTLILFIWGFMYGFGLMYYALIVLAEINVRMGIQNIWDIGLFLSQIILTATLLGVLFQFPIVITFIIRTGVFDVTFLRQKRRVAMLIIFIFTSLLPPTDGLSLVAMALPLILLYEVTILVNSKFRKRESITI